MPIHLAQKKMATDREVPSSRIEGLPLELVQIVLSALPDVSSLQAAVLSCPLFYRSFMRAERAIVTQVLSNQVDISVLPEAIAASESSWLRPHDTDPKSRAAIVDFVDRNLHRRPMLSEHWSLIEAIPISRFHFHLQALTEMFIKATFSKSPLEEYSSVATHQERNRIERAFYRFEIYCNLFRESRRSAESIVYEEQRELFFQNFAAWENEQLGCIHDFLFEVIAPGQLPKTTN